MMSKNFIDCLMLERFDIFQAIIADIEQIKFTLKRQNRRVKKLVCSYTAYEVMKKVSKLVNKVLNARRIKSELAIGLFVKAIGKLRHLVNELQEFGRNELAATLFNLAERLFNLLPPTTVIQLELFDSERYDNGSNTAPRTVEFLSWLRWYSNCGFTRLHTAFKESFKPIKAYNLSIEFNCV